MQSTVAKRYAEALFSAVLDAGRLQQVDAEAQSLATLFSDRSVRNFLTTPQIAAERKKAVIDKQLAGKLDSTLINLLKLMVDKNRIGELPQVLEYFDQLTDQSRGVEEVTIYSAVPLSDEQRSTIVDQLKRFSAYGELRVRAEVDPALLGGVLIKLGRNLVLDGSVSSRLAALRTRLEKARLKLAL
jgi:F-type H+-transporting ATPase subunit delta